MVYMYVYIYIDIGWRGIYVRFSNYCQTSRNMICNTSFNVLIAPLIDVFIGEKVGAGSYMYLSMRENVK